VQTTVERQCICHGHANRCNISQKLPIHAPNIVGCPLMGAFGINEEARNTQDTKHHYYERLKEGLSEKPQIITR